jgi:hypothetical protein
MNHGAAAHRCVDNRVITFWQASHKLGLLENSHESQRVVFAHKSYILKGILGFVGAR